MPVCHLRIRRHLSSYWRTCCPTEWGPLATSIAIALCRLTEWLRWIRTIKLRNCWNGYRITLTKIMLNSRNSQTAQMLSFHSGFCTVRLSLSDALALACILGSTKKYQDVTLLFCPNILWAFTRPIVANKKRQHGTKFLKADNNKINIMSSQGRVIS